MATVHPPPTDSEANACWLYEQVSALLDALRTGGVATLDDRLRQRPDLADDLRGLWAAALIAEELARSAGESFSADAPATIVHDSTAEATPVDGPDERLGPYSLIAEIGRGGMGVVYRVRDERIGREIALKRIIKGSLANEVDRARFRAEVEAAAQLDHPHVLPVFDVGEHDGQPYYTMPLVAGPTLSRRLQDGPLPARESAVLLAKVARAIDFAHRAGILHRDVKPANILIDACGEPHVADFGLAKRLDAEPGDQPTRSGAIVGTPGYLAPEQAAAGRGPVGPAADVYGLGAVLYHMLTGRPPFQAASAVDTLLLVLEQEPLPPRLLNPKADRDLELIALKCLQKPIDLRYRTAADLAADLEAYLAAEPIAARSGRFSDVASRLLGETHHAAVLENWGLLWMWHAIVLLALCLVTNAMKWQGIESPWPYLLLWTVGLAAWAAIFWAIRRRDGPVSFVERQIAHLWAGSVASCWSLFLVEMAMGLPVLTLSPVLAIVSGVAFLAKAGILSGRFYVQAVAGFATALPMAWWPEVGITLFGVVSSLSFFLPGWKYHQQRLRSRRAGLAAELR